MIWTQGKRTMHLYFEHKIFHITRMIHEAFQCLIKKKKNPTIANIIVNERKRNLENN